MFDAQGHAEALRPRPRAVVARDHGRRGREGRRLEWTCAPHAWGPKSSGVPKRADYGARRLARLPPGVTAGVAPRALGDGLEGRGPAPHGCAAAEASGPATMPESDGHMECVFR